MLLLYETNVFRLDIFPEPTSSVFAFTPKFSQSAEFKLPARPSNFVASPKFILEKYTVCPFVSKFEFPTVSDVFK